MHRSKWLTTLNMVRLKYNGSLSNAFRLKQGYDEKQFLVEMNVVTGKDIAEHVISPAKVIPACLVTVSRAIN